MGEAVAESNETKSQQHLDAKEGLSGKPMRASQVENAQDPSKDEAEDRQRQQVSEIERPAEATQPLGHDDARVGGTEVDEV